MIYCARYTFTILIIVTALDEIKTKQKNCIELLEGEGNEQLFSS